MAHHRNCKRWTDAEKEVLIAERGKGTKWEDIARITAHPMKSCKVIYSRVKKERGLKGYIDPKWKNRREWPASEVDQLLYMREVDKKSFAEIDAILGRAPGASSDKWTRLEILRKRSRGEEFVSRNAKAFAEREKRQIASFSQSLTASILGDPPPGYSALDRKQNAANRPDR